MKGGEDVETATLPDGRAVLVFDRSEFETEEDYQAALAGWLREKGNAPLRQNHPDFPMMTRNDI